MNNQHEYLENTVGSAYKFYEMTQISSTEFQAAWGRINNYPTPNGTKIYPMADFQLTLDKKRAKGYI